MAKERISLGVRKRARLEVLHEIEPERPRQIEAARRLQLTGRHVQHLLLRLRTEGDRGLLHRLRGLGTLQDLLV